MLRLKREKQYNFQSNTTYILNQMHGLYRLLNAMMAQFKNCPFAVNPLAPDDIYVYKSYRTANLQTLHFKYFLNIYTYRIF